MSEKSLRRRMLDGVFWLTLVKVSSQAISWTITVYVIRILSPGDYGLMAMAGVYLGFIILFNEVGLGAAIIQRKDLSQEELSSICWAVLSINLTLYAFAFFSAPLVARFYNEPRVAEVIRVASVVFILRGIGLVPNNILARELAFKRQSQAELISSMAGPVATLWLATEGYGVWSLVYGNIVLEMVRTSMSYVLRPWKPQFSFSFAKVRTLIQFGAKVAVTRLLWFLCSNVDFLIAGKILGKTQLGYYSVAVQLAMIPLDKLVSTVAYVTFPALSRVQDDPALLRRYYLKIVELVAFVTFPACWGIYLIAESAVPLFLSEKWLPVILPLQILSTVTAFRAVQTINAPLEMAIGKAGVAMLNVAIIAVIMSACFYIGSSYGLAGLAYAWLAFPVAFLITTSITVRLIGLSLRQYCRGLGHPFLGTSLMVLLVLLCQKLVLVHFGLLVQAAGSVAVGLVSYILYYAIFNRRMFEEARNLLRR